MKKRAFTLIELLVVIAIIAILMGILMPALQRVREQARQKACGTRIRQQILALNMYADDNNTKFPLPTTRGYWLWDVSNHTVNYMLKTGLSREMFYCPSNDNQQKYNDYYWEFTAEWDDGNGRFIDVDDSDYIVSGYCYILETTRNDRPKIITYPERGDSRDKMWVKTNMTKHPALRELCIDATLGQPDTNAKHGYNFGMIDAGGMWAGQRIVDRTSHLKTDEEPAGGNIGYLDGHVDWRHFSEMYNRYGNPTFWW